MVRDFLCALNIMSSVARAYAQLPAHGQFFYVPVNSNHGGFTNVALAARLAANASNVISFDGLQLNTKDYGTFLNGMSAESISQGNLFRDMGKEIHVLQNGVKAAVFRYGQLVDDNDNLTEGVGSSPNLFLCTWQSAGTACPSALSMVKVVRA